MASKICMSMMTQLTIHRANRSIGALWISKRTALRDAQTAITVSVPMQATVNVRPPSFIAGELVDSVTVNYEIAGADAVYKPNVVEIELPDGWEPSHGNAAATPDTADMQSFGSNNAIYEDPDDGGNIKNNGLDDHGDTSRGQYRY